MLTTESLRRLWPHGDSKVPGLIDGIVAAAPAVFAKYGLTTPLVVAHAMAQFSHECGAGLEMVENLNYSARGLQQTWPARFSASKALAYQHQPQKIADEVYDGRMGDKPDSDDGWNYRGRGLSQTTGRQAYAKLGEIAGLDLLTNPDQVNDPMHALECAVADFVVICHCLPFAQKDDVRGVTHHLNGGFIGEAQREEWLRKWKKELSAAAPAPRSEVSAALLAIPDALAPTEAHADEVADDTAPEDQGLVFGDKGWEVEAVQTRLTELGYPVGKPDGCFNEATRAAVLAFQANEGLSTTGVIDQATRARMTDAPQKPVSEGRATVTLDDLRADGSRTIAATDNIGVLGKIKMWGGGILGGGWAAQQSGMVNLDTIQSGVDKAHQAYGILDSIKELIPTGLLSHPATPFVAVGLAGLGFLVWKNARKAAVARLDDHRSGDNMGR